MTRVKKSAPNCERTNGAYDVVIDLSNGVVDSSAGVDSIERLEPKRHDTGGVERIVPEDVEDGEDPNVPTRDIALYASHGERSGRLAVDGGKSALNDLEILLLEPKRGFPVSLTGQCREEDESQQRDGKSDDSVNDEKPEREEGVSERLKSIGSESWTYQRHPASP